MATVLDDLLARVGGLPQEKVADLIEASRSLDFRWTPNPGPQTDAYFSAADILLYGGQAGGGKTDLLVGLACQEHQRSIIFRRESSQTDGIIAAGKRIIGESAGYNGQDLEWTWPDGKSLKLAGMKDADDWTKHAGRERDLIGFDEAGEFLLGQVVSLLGWNRGPAGQRCRVVLASNPPRSADGLWMIEWFAPWLDRRFDNPALPGELRWAVLIGGSPRWVDSPDEVEIDGETMRPMSFSFIPAALSDNPERNTVDYRSRLQSLPEPLRSQLLYGDFSIGLEDSQNQTIPTAWVTAAMDRWTEKPPPGIPMCAIGVDASGGGKDPMIIAIRHDGWFAPLIEVPGASIPMHNIGPFCSGILVSHRRDRALVVIDMSGGYGGSMFDHLRANEVEVVAYKGAEASARRSREGKLAFVNTRSAAYWWFREALDPSQPGGSPIMLPDDPRLLADLTAPIFEVNARGIALEPKEKIMKRLGRSTDRGDAAVMAWFEGPRHLTHALEWIEERGLNKRGQQPRVIMGRR